jgi:hypothetical protein
MDGRMKLLIPWPGHERKRPGSQYPLQGKLPMKLLLRWLHILKIPSLPNSAWLRIKLLTLGPLTLSFPNHNT